MTSIEMVRALPNREAIENAVMVLISVLDALDGDLDLEDSEGGGNLVDERGRYLGGDWPTEDDEPDEDLHDSAFCEWHTRGRHKVTGEGHEQFDPVGEDNEDDDPDTGVEDDPEGIDPESDYGGEEAGEEEHVMCCTFGLDQSSPVGPDNLAVEI